MSDYQGETGELYKIKYLPKMRISLDLHDFSVLNNRLDLLLKIKEHYPNFKVSMFTIPYDYVSESSVEGRTMREKTLKAIKDNLDWIQIIPHGLTHMPREFENCDKETFRLALASIDEAFKKDDLPYEKGFCAPYWLWNQDVVDVLDERGWWGAIDRNQPTMLRTKKTYTYSHSIDQPFWGANNIDVMKLHGHIDGQSKNDLENNFIKLFRLPSNVEWHFVTDFLTENGKI